MGDKMRERMARAIASANGDPWDCVPASKREWNRRAALDKRDINQPFKSDYLDMADAALAAMREPSDAMIEAGREWLVWCDLHDETPEPKSGWINMIDAARNEESAE